MDTEASTAPAFSALAWIKAVRETDFGNPKTRLLAYEHLAYSDRGLTQPALSRLAAALDLKTRQVITLRGDLVKMGFLHLVKKGDGRPGGGQNRHSSTSVYMLTLPSDQTTKNHAVTSPGNRAVTDGFSAPFPGVPNQQEQGLSAPSDGQVLHGSTASFAKSKDQVPVKPKAGSGIGLEADTETPGISHLVKTVAMNSSIEESPTTPTTIASNVWDAEYGELDLYQLFGCS